MLAHPHALNDLVSGLLLDEAMQRSFEGAAASKFGMGFGAERACFDVVKQVLRSKTGSFDSFGKYLVKAIATDAIWCNDRFAEAGYDTDGLCPLCGCDDSLHHINDH